jgi:hypothetical protein
MPKSKRPSPIASRSPPAAGCHLWSVVATHGRRALAGAPATRSDGRSLRTRGRDARSRCPRSADHPQRRLAESPDRRDRWRTRAAWPRASARRGSQRCRAVRSEARDLTARGDRGDIRTRASFGRKRGGRPRPQFGSVLLLRAAGTHQPRRVPTRNPQLGVCARNPAVSCADPWRRAAAASISSEQTAWRANRIRLGPENSSDSL